MAGIHQAEKSRYGLVIEGFWLGDKCRIIAGSNNFDPTYLLERPIKVGARVSYMPGGCMSHVASAFPLAHHYRAVLAWGPQAPRH